MKQRVALWDNVKWLMIVFMLIGHFIEVFIDKSEFCKEMFLFLYSFHMPVLFFISGLFYKKEKAMKNVIFFISSGFALKIALCVKEMILYQHFKFSVFSEKGSPWFMFVLAAYFFIMYFCENINKKYLLIASVLLACFAGYDKTLGDFLYVSRIIVFLPFFISGVMIDPNKMIEFRQKYLKIGKIFSVLIIAAWVFICFNIHIALGFSHLFTGRNPFTGDVISKIGLFARLCCYVITSFVGLSFIFLCPSKKIPGVTVWGSRTLNVYFWHWILFEILRHYFGFEKIFTIGVWSGPVIYILSAVVITCILSLKIFEFPLKQIKDICFYKLIKDK